MEYAQKILLVEDSLQDAELIVHELRHAGFDFEWQRVETEEAFLEHLHAGLDLVLADYQMPQFSGLRALELLKQSGLEIPLIIVSGSIGEETAVAAMRLGASDYLLKDRLARLGVAVSHALGETRLRRERKRAEVALQASEARYRTMLHGIEAGVIVHGPDGSIVAFNPQACELLGVGPEDMTVRAPGDPRWKRVQADGSPFPENQLPYRQALITRQPVRDVILGLNRRGLEEFAWLLVSATPALTPEGAVDEVIVTLVDVTSRARAEQAVQRQQIELRALFDLFPAMIWFKDTQNRILRINQKVAETIGKPVEAIEGKSSADIYPEAAAKYYADDLEVIRTGAPKLAIIEQVSDAQGHDIWVQTDKVPVRDYRGSITGIIVVARDISVQKKADEELRKNEERFRSLATELAAEKRRLVEAQAVAKAGSWETDAATFAVTWSEETYRIFETDPEIFPVTHAYFLERIHPDDRAAVDAAFLESLKQAATSSIEHRITLPGGRIKFVEERWRTTFDEEGKPIRISGTCQDITDRKRTAETLRLLSSAVEHSNESIIITDAELDLPGPKIIFVNPAFTQMTGYSPREAVGKTPRILQGPRTSRELMRHLRQTLERGGRFQGETVNYRKDGTEFHLDWQIAPMRDASGKTTHHVAIQRDVTARHLADEALRVSEKRFKAFFEQAAVGVAQTDAVTAQFIHVNQRFCEIVGRAREDIERLKFTEITHPLDLDRNMETMRELRSGKIREATWEKRYLRPDRSEVWVNLTVSAMWAPGEEPGLCLAVVQDITALKQLEDQYRQAQKMEAIGTLAGGIAHDFNNVLAAINGYTELVKMESEGNEVVLGYLDAVLRGARRATDLVRQILAFSRQQALERSPIQLQPVVEEALKLLRATIPTTIEFDARLEAEGPTVLADASQVHQLIMNLCTNAAHAMKDGPGRLTVTLEKITVDAEQAAVQHGLRIGCYARLSVSDAGCGMDEATLRRIFEPFFTTKAPGEGTGLGLAVVHGIMQSHEGVVTVESRLGVGTTFHLYFPEHIVEKIEEGVRPQTIAPWGAGERILFVDDEQPLVTMGKKILERLGYVVETRSNAAEALAAVQAQPAAFDLVVTDQTMPGMTGTMLAEKIRAVRRDLPIILTTGYSATLTAERVQAMGIRQLLLKPLTIDALGSAVGRALREARTP